MLLIIHQIFSNKNKSFNKLFTNEKIKNILIFYSLIEFFKVILKQWPHTVAFLKFSIDNHCLFY